MELCAVAVRWAPAVPNAARSATIFVARRMQALERVNSPFASGAARHISHSRQKRSVQLTSQAIASCARVRQRVEANNMLLVPAQRVTHTNRDKRESSTSRSLRDRLIRGQRGAGVEMHVGLASRTGPPHRLTTGSRFTGGSEDQRIALGHSAFTCSIANRRPSATGANVQPLIELPCVARKTFAAIYSARPRATFGQRTASRHHANARDAHEISIIPIAVFSVMGLSSEAALVLSRCSRGSNWRTFFTSCSARKAAPLPSLRAKKDNAKAHSQCFSLLPPALPATRSLAEGILATPAPHAPHARKRSPSNESTSGKARQAE
ncbi:hypothetical protein TRVL_10073 [Trypanosoma vivax]|nr:hypothetical protein TRVL_10073 [Trypanosoma vivax]